MYWMTQNADRPDLAALEVNAPFGFVGSNFYPVEVKTEKTGDTSYVTVTPDSAPGSVTEGTAPSATMIATSTKAWTLTRRFKRYGVGESEVQSMGGVEKADNMGGKAAKRSIMRYVEGLQLTQLMSGSNPGSIYPGKVISSIQGALEDIRRYPGAKAMCLNFKTYHKLITCSEIVGRLSYHGWMGEGADSVLGLHPDVLKSMLSNVFGIENIFIADDDLCADNKIALAALPSADELSYKLDPELGKTFVFIPDGGTEFKISSFPFPKDLANYYDAETFNSIVEFNAGARKVLSWTDAAPSSTAPASGGTASSPA